ncbi:hypothetical protein [Kitasatospora sp. NPDC088351]
MNQYRGFAREDEVGVEAIDTIKPATTSSDPAPEVLIDDTLATTAP